MSRYLAICSSYSAASISFYVLFVDFLVYRVHLSFQPRIVPPVPSEAPQQVNGRTVNSTSIEITWNPVRSPHRKSIVAGYKVLHVVALTSHDVDNATAVVAADAANVDAAGGRFVVGNLDKFTPYKIWVCAFTESGNGPMSDVIVVKTDEDGTWTGAVERR